MHNRFINLVSFAISCIINVITAISSSEEHSVVTFRIRLDFATPEYIKSFFHSTPIGLKTVI